MSVRLIALSQPIDGRTPEDLMVYCARVSNPSNQDNVETGAKLLKYCLDHGHVSVFETASMTVEIRTTRVISAQLLRHRSFTFQEFSQRYAAVSDMERARAPSARIQDRKNRQSSRPCTEAEAAIDEWWEDTSASIMDVTRSIYDAALEKGIAKEVARYILPMATPTTIYMTGSVRSWIHYLKARLDPATQAEHRDVAEYILEIFVEQFPVVAEAAGLVKEEVDLRDGLA